MQGVKFNCNWSRKAISGLKVSLHELLFSVNDYVPLSTTFTFLRTDTNPDQEICTNIGALNDNNIESLETFQISVSTNDDSVIKGEAVVMIEDVDGKLVLKFADTIFQKFVKFSRFDNFFPSACVLCLSSFECVSHTYSFPRELEPKDK